MLQDLYLQDSLYKDDNTDSISFYALVLAGHSQVPPKRVIDQRAEPLEGISKMHTIFIDSNGTLKGKELSCENCLVDYRCGE